MALRLLQFPLSVFCEKARFALDFQQLSYKVTNLLPGPHRVTLRRLGAVGTTVPILIDSGRLIEGSAAIVDHLEAVTYGRSLLPRDPALQGLAREWERHADEELGVHARLLFYSAVIDDTPLVTSLLTEGTGVSPLGARLYGASFPLIRHVMKRRLSLTPDAVGQSQNFLRGALRRLDDLVSGRDYLVGDHFTRADLAVSSMLAPFALPDEHMVSRSPVLSALVRGIRGPFSEFVITEQGKPWVSWLTRIYREHRKASPTSAGA